MWMRSVFVASVLLAGVGFFVGCDRTHADSGSNSENTSGATSANVEQVEKTAVKDKEAWKEKLDPMTYRVACEGGTEPAFSGKYWNEHRPGVYVDALTGVPLFSSQTKFDSGTGWPSFYNITDPDAVELKLDDSHGMQRTEVVSKSSGAHLGHVFNDGPKPTGLRYCINSASLIFIPGATMPADPSVPLLGARLYAKQQAFNKKADADTKRVYEQGVEVLGERHVGANAPKIGEKAPDFELPTATGEPVKLSELLKKGPVVLTWYRGGWCPYCNLQLHAYQEVLPRFEALGAQLVAVSPQLPDNSLDTKQKNALAFAVLSDVGNKVAKQYDLVYTLPEPVQQKFAGRLDLAKYNGDDSAALPLTATFVIAPDGTVVYRFVDTDYRKRAEPGDILGALEKLKSAGD